MKIFQINDCDWWVGESLDACIGDYIANYCDADGVDEDARELTDEELDSLFFTDPDTDCDERPTGFKRTFREQLAVEIAAGGEFPRMFASTEY